MLLRLRFILGLLPVFWLVAATASATYPVGTADVVYVDPDRDRPVPVDLYYPAEAAGWDQPVADPPPGGFASVSFGHGYLIPAGSYAWIAERLAAAGCVVALPRTGGELFPDHAEFGDDLAFLARHLRDAGADAASPFFGRMGPRNLVMGHSMGGGCSFLAAASDPSITAVANFAAAETNPSAIAACGLIDCDVAIFSGTADCVTPPADHQIPMYEGLAGGWRTHVTIAGASHCQFNAYSFVCELGEPCSADISRQEQQDLVWLLMEPWIRAVLFLESGAAQEFQTLLDTTPEFTYEQQGAVTAVAAHAPRIRPRLEAVPNPFNPMTEIRFELAVTGRVGLSIYDLGGRRVAEVIAGVQEAGAHVVSWNGRDNGGRALPSGTYFVRLSTDSGVATKKVSLVR